MNWMAIVIASWVLPTTVEGPTAALRLESARLEMVERAGQSGVRFAAVVVNEVDAPPLPDGVDRDPVRKQMDWGESADVFGMVPLRLSIDAKSKLEIHNFVTSEARLPDLAIGQIMADGTQAIVEVHREKAQHALDALKGKAFNGAQVNAQIAD